MSDEWVRRLKRRTIIHILLAISFFVSGFAINFAQLLLWLTLKRANLVLFRKINYYLCYGVWCQLAFLVECWAGCTVRLHGDKKLHETVGKERAIILMNHTYEIDGVMTWVVCDHVGILGNAKVMAKKSLKFAPIVGWTWYLAEILFVDRDWNKDQVTLSRQFDTLLDWPDPFWLLVYPEGTRFSKKKHEASVEFAKSKGLPELKHHLVPRTKGFTWLRQNTKGKIDVVYNVQLGFDSKCRDNVSMSALLRGEPLLCDIYMERLELESLPKEDPDVHDWLMDLFKQKDKMFDRYMRTNDFFTPEEREEMGIQTVNFGVRLWPVINVSVWVLLVHGYILNSMISNILAGSFVIPSLFCAVVLGAAYGLDKMVNLTRMEKASTYGEIGAKKKD